MTNISETEHFTIKEIEANPTLSSAPIINRLPYTQFLAISRLADAAERIADALESINRREQALYNKTFDGDF